MSGKGRYLFHGGVLPDDYLIQGVAVRAYKLIVCFRKYEVAHLRPGVDCVERLQGLGVPEPNVLIGSATPGCEKASV